METLPDEIILLIFENILKITDKRQFLRTCTKYNTTTKYSIQSFEQDYFVRYFNKIDYYCVEKFTLELCYDKYFNMIPITYINFDNKIIAKALAAFNNIELLKIAKNNGCNFDDINYYASLYGHLEILKWAFANGYYHGCTTISETAALNGHLDILKWANSNTRGNCNNVCVNAARNGHLECLIWARKIGVFPWDHRVCIYAARNGHFEVLKWARKNGCDWNRFVCTNAKMNGHYDILNWAIDNGCPG